MLAQGFAGIEEELRSQYLLEYRPADFKQDGAFRTIYLQANDRALPRARAHRLFRAQSRRIGISFASRPLVLRRFRTVRKKARMSPRYPVRTKTLPAG